MQGYIVERRFLNWEKARDGRQKEEEEEEEERIGEGEREREMWRKAGLFFQ